MAKLKITPEMRAKWKRINAARAVDEDPPLNFPLLVKTRNRIDAIPESYDQETFGQKDKMAPCGTRACLAGEILICSERSIPKGLEKLWRTISQGDVARSARHAAGLQYYEGESLFYSGVGEAWAEPFSSKFLNANTNKQRARIAVAYLTHIIRTGRVLE